MRTRERLKIMERIISDVIIRALDGSAELQAHFTELRSKGWKLETLLAACIEATPPMRAPRRWGKKDRAFLHGIGVDPDRVAK